MEPGLGWVRGQSAEAPAQPPSPTLAGGCAGLGWEHVPLHSGLGLIQSLHGLKRTGQGPLEKQTPACRLSHGNHARVSSRCLHC